MNQNPEQLARDRIDDQLTACGWFLQDKNPSMLVQVMVWLYGKYLTGASSIVYKNEFYRANGNLFVSD